MTQSIWATNLMLVWNRLLKELKPVLLLSPWENWECSSCREGQKYRFHIPPRLRECFFFFLCGFLALGILECLVYPGHCAGISCGSRPNFDHGCGIVRRQSGHCCHLTCRIGQKLSKSNSFDDTDKITAIDIRAMTQRGEKSPAASHRLRGSNEQRSG